MTATAKTVSLIPAADRAALQLVTGKALGATGVIVNTADLEAILRALDEAEQIGLDLGLP
jgi:hypothetical protein